MKPFSTFLNYSYSNLKQTQKQISYDFGFISAHPLDVKQFFIQNSGFKYGYSSDPNGNLIQFKSNLINRFDGFETPELAFVMSFFKTRFKVERKLQLWSDKP